jgi:hypothetical protein
VCDEGLIRVKCGQNLLRRSETNCSTWSNT